jgi:hypothetical protein
MAANDDVEYLPRLVKALAETCRAEGVRRCVVHGVEIEMAVVRNPITEQDGRRAAGRSTSEPAPAPSKPGLAEWLDASGNAVAVLRQPKVPV